LADHLEPIQQWRITQLAWFMRLNKWKQRLLSLLILGSGPFVMMIRLFVFTLNMIYAVASAFSFIVIHHMIRNRRKVSNLELVIGGRPVSPSFNGNNDCSSEMLSSPASEHVGPDLAAQRDSISSFALESSAKSLGQVAHSLQRPVIFRCQRFIEALSTPALQPWALLFSIARVWLKICIFVNSCDSAVDKWYLNRCKLLQERMAMLDVQQEEAERKRRTEAEQQSHHGLVHSVSDPTMQSAQEIQHLQQEQKVYDVEPPPGFGLHIPELETCSPASASIEVPPKIIASELRMRRPREPWLLLWVNLHVSKVEQVILVICDSTLFLNFRPCRFFGDSVSLFAFLS
jgi:hypothetical protein